MKTLYVLYDTQCGLCTEVKDWIRKEPAFLDVQLLPAGTEETRRRFPSLPPGELTVVSDAGQVWLGDNAFIVCLWALRRYREWARRLSSPVLRPMARRAFDALSQNRHNISQLLRLKSEAELKRKLSEVPESECPIK